MSNTRSNVKKYLDDLKKRDPQAYDKLMDQMSLLNKPTPPNPRPTAPPLPVSPTPYLGIWDWFKKYNTDNPFDFDDAQTFEPRSDLMTERKTVYFEYTDTEEITFYDDEGYANVASMYGPSSVQDSVAEIMARKNRGKLKIEDDIQIRLTHGVDVESVQDFAGLAFRAECSIRRGFSKFIGDLNESRPSAVRETLSARPIPVRFNIRTIEDPDLIVLLNQHFGTAVASRYGVKVPSIVLRRQETVLIAPYNANGVQAIKTQFPFEKRRWDSDKKVWIFPADKTILLTLIQLVEENWGMKAKLLTDNVTTDQVMEGDTLDMTNFFTILGVTKEATSEEIKKAYRTSVRRFHPDVGSRGDANLFRIVQKAYDTLKDENRRKRYLAALMVTEQIGQPQTGRRRF